MNEWREADLPVIRVAAAVIERDGCFLLARRGEATHLAGYWEFPGGKCRPGESVVTGLQRELAEELEIGVEIGDRLLVVDYDYPDRRLELHFYRCRPTSEPRAALGQELRWIPPAGLRELRLPPADAALVELLAPAPGPKAPD